MDERFEPEVISPEAQRTMLRFVLLMELFLGVAAWMAW